MPEKTEDLLLELGCEEIPATYITPALRAMEKYFIDFAARERLSHGEIRTWATPRRLAMLVSGVAASQPAAIEEIKGPPAKAALLPDGSFGPTAMKFSESRGGGKLEVRSTEKGEYVFLVRKNKGCKTTALLPGFLTSLIPSIPFPKRMRWTDGPIQFARPIRWIVFLFGAKALRVAVDGVTSGANTRGHRFLSSNNIRVASPGAYIETLEKAGVMPDHDKRREYIRAELSRLSSGTPVIPEELLEEVGFQNEYPHVIEGAFNKQFLEIPPEALMICIEKTQKFFPVKGAAGRLTPRFLAVLNVPPDGEGVMLAALEKVLLSRLKDASFFYKEDLKTPLVKRVADLEKVTFQKGLGTLLNKCERLHALVAPIGAMAGLKESRIQIAQRAAALCKADLTTGLVFEFPELQGIAGKYYASVCMNPAEDDEGCGSDAEDPRVPIAIKEHYMPRSADDSLPSTPQGALLAVADRLDTLAGYFSVGLVPSGSEDPYSLRRQALGVIRILEARKYPVSVRALIEAAVKNYPADLVPEEKRESTAAALLDFFAGRLRTYLIETHGRSYDAVNAADLSRPYEVGTVAALTAALDELRPKTEFQELLQVFDRVSNILRKSASSADFKASEPDPALFAQDEERELLRLAGEARAARNELPADAHAARIETLFRITPAAHTFFDKVMVMSEDPAIRANRLALLTSLRAVYLEIADFARMVKS